MKEQLHALVETLNDSQITYVYNLLLRLFGG